MASDNTSCWWAFVDGVIHTLPEPRQTSGFSSHAAWYEAIGLPMFGLMWDSIPRGGATVWHDLKRVLVSAGSELAIPAEVWEHFARTYEGYELVGNGMPWDELKPANI